MSSIAPARVTSEHLGEQGVPQHPAGHRVAIPHSCQINEQGPEDTVSPPFITSAAPICKHFPQITFKMYEMSPLVHLTVSE